MDLLTSLIALGTASLTGLVSALKWQTSRAKRLSQKCEALQTELDAMREAQIAEAKENELVAVALLKQLGVNPNDVD